jgi:hypothetical protein
MDVGIKVEGIQELAKALRKAGTDDLKRQLTQTNRTAAQMVVQAALPRVPVGPTGRLRASVRALASQTSGSAVAGKARVPYAAAVHWGRKNGNVGRPSGNHKGPNRIHGGQWLWLAAQATIPRIEPEYRDAIEQIITEATRNRNTG